VIELMLPRAGGITPDLFGLVVAVPVVIRNLDFHIALNVTAQAWDR
jgi:hypothetical protein